MCLTNTKQFLHAVKLFMVWCKCFKWYVVTEEMATKLFLTAKTHYALARVKRGKRE